MKTGNSILCLVILGILAGCYSKNQEVNIEIGVRYIHSFYWDEEDPFEEIRIDTVKVVSIRGGYVQWEYRNGFKLSGKANYFKKRIRKCNCN